MDALDYHREPPVNLTSMVMAFGGCWDASQAATGVLRHLIQPLSALHLATIDPEEFFVFTQRRPGVRLADDGHPVMEWPQSEFYTWEPSSGQDGLLLFCGMEPDLKWRAYTTAFLDVAEQCGVQRIVSLGAFLAGAPHTRPPRVTGRSTDPDWQARLEAWGIAHWPSDQGPTGIASVVLEAARGRGMSSVTLMGHAPYYLQGAENPAVMQALLSDVTRLLDLGLEGSQLDEAVQAFRAEWDQAAAREPALQGHVRQLEQDYDAAVDAASGPLRDDVRNSDQLMQEVEDFLRKEREDRGWV